MGGIPVLNDSQLTALRRVVGTNQKLNLTVTPQGKPRKLPSYAEDYEAAEYNGYFKIVDASTVNESGAVSNKIKIVDGATYDSTSGTSGKSVCKVNNAVFQVDVFAEDVSQSKIYVLKFTAATKASGDTPASAAKVEIVSVDDVMPSDDKSTAYFQIGRVIVTDGEMKIQQDHTAGVAQIYWYLLCSEDEE